MVDTGKCECCGTEDFVEPCPNCASFVCGACFSWEQGKCVMCMGDKKEPPFDKLDLD